MFKMSSGPATRKGPELFLSLTAGFNPTFAFEAPHPAPEHRDCESSSSIALLVVEVRTCFNLAKALAPASETETDTEAAHTLDPLSPADNPDVRKDIIAVEDESHIDPPAAPTTGVDDLNLLITTYPTSMQQLSADQTTKLVALGHATTLAAYNADAQRDYAAAVANLDGLHMFAKDFDLDAELEVAFEDYDDIEASDAERIGTPMPELSLVVLVSSEDSSPRLWHQPDDQGVFTTWRTAVAVSSAPSSQCMMSKYWTSKTPVTSRSRLLSSASILSQETVTTPRPSPWRGSDTAAERTSSEHADPVVDVPYAIDGSHPAASVTAGSLIPSLSTPRSGLP